MRLGVVSLFVCGVFLFPAVNSASDQPSLTTVSRVDLKRYVGAWYEIARFPNRFQKQCVGDVQASYAERPDGNISVRNTCKTTKGKEDVANGTARIVDKQTNAKLKVTFFWPFYGNYWIIGLDEDYRYAIVGEPDRKYLWILSRDPHISETKYNELIEQARQKGYDVSKLVRTPQTTR